MQWQLSNVDMTVTEHLHGSQTMILTFQEIRSMSSLLRLRQCCSLQLCHSPVRPPICAKWTERWTWKTLKFVTC